MSQPFCSTPEAGPSSPFFSPSAGGSSHRQPTWTTAHDPSSSLSSPPKDPLSPARNRNSPDQKLRLTTRPALARRTTDSAGARGSTGLADSPTATDGVEFGGLRRRALGSESKGKERERDDEDVVEVLVHELEPADSLPRIALLYGIDLAVLRKSNKLWTSDSLHVRKTLYIPLGACHLREELVRGPNEDEVTLVGLPLATGSAEKERQSISGHYSRGATLPKPTFEPDLNSALISPIGQDAEDNPWVLQGTNVSYDPSTSLIDIAQLVPPIPSSSPNPSTPPVLPAPPDPPRSSRMLKLLRMSRKDLSYFPRSAPSSTRSSLDSSLLLRPRSEDKPRTISLGTNSTRSITRKLSSLFLDVPNLLPNGPTSPLSSTQTGLGNGRPAYSARQRSASDLIGRSSPSASRTSSDLLHPSSPEGEHVELARLASRQKTQRVGGKQDWFANGGFGDEGRTGGKERGVVDRQLAPQGAMVVGGRRGEQGEDVWIG